MTEYSWPDWGNYRTCEATAEAVWGETVRALPVGTAVSGEVIGRQPFGVFLTIDNHPEAIGLAKITAMPRCLELPPVGARVTGRVLWHADHNHQVGIKLTEWDDHADLLPPFAKRIGQAVTGQVTKLAPIGAFVRIADCVEGLVRLEDLPVEPVMEGQELPVTILAVDLDRHRVSLSAMRGRRAEGQMEEPIRMAELRCEAVRWVDDEPWPGWVEVQFTDAAGQRWSLFDTPPIFAALDELGPDSEYPMEVTVACVVREGRYFPEDGEIISVSTSPHGVTSPDGRDEFTVRRDQLVR